MLNAGGFRIRLSVSDRVLLGRIRTAFPGGKRPSRSDMALRVDAAGSGLESEALPPRWMRLDGEGDYAAAFAPNLRQARVWVNPRAPLRGLAGALRRFHTRWLMAHGGAVFHAACVVRTGQAYLFFGRSGAGKTTVCRLSRPARAAADDLIAVRVRRGRAVVWGLPAFHRPPYILANGPFPVRAAFILKQAAYVRLDRLTPAQAAASMLGIPQDWAGPEPAAAALEVAAALARTAPCYALHFRKDPLFWRDIQSKLG